MKQKNKKIIYYSDPKKDDFFGKKIEVKNNLENFKYIHKNWFYRFSAFLFRNIIIIPLIWLICLFTTNAKVINKKFFKSLKHKGYYLYNNHTGVYDIFNCTSKLNAWKHPVFIASRETFNIKGLKHLVSFLGAIPVPKGEKMYQGYTECMSYHIQKGHKVIIYPEAHIWPFYTGIREFTGGSFRYPVNDNAPIIVATTTYRKRKFRSLPKQVIYLDGPFYPDKNLPYEEAVNKLRDECYNAMKKRSEIENNYARYEYIKKD